jgi:hypothetical protein
MDWQKNRIFIASVVLVLIGGLAIWAVQSRTGDSPQRAGDVPEGFPDVDREAIAVLEITRPEDEGMAVRLERGEDGTWRLTAPIEAPADQGAVSTALDKLDEMDVASIAASNAQFHERLEVDTEHGVHVVARDQEGETLADVWIGAFRSGNTMVRVEGQDVVAGVRGSIKFAFNKELRDWRDRSMLALEADDVREAAFVGPNGTFRFVRPTVQREAPEGEGEGEGEGPSTELGDWQIAEVSYVPPPTDGGVAARVAQSTIEGFAPTKVRSIVSSLARMRASDFAASDVTREGAGITDASPRVTLTVGEGDAATQHVVRLGSEANEERHDYYAMREGDETIFVISRFLGERVHPTAASFTQTAAPATPEPAEGAGAMPHPGGEVGGGAQLPPEVMEQIRRQLEQQGLGGGAGP